MKVGRPGGENRKKTFKLEGDKKLSQGVFRILPPLGSLADSGQWYKKYEVEWGYVGSDGRQKPFLSCRKIDFENSYYNEDGKKIFPVLVESAAHLKRQEMKAKKAELVELLKAGKVSRDQFEKKMAQYDAYNLDVKFYLNAVNLNNEIGLLKVNSSFYKALKAAREKYKQDNDGKDLLDMYGGVYLTFRRTNETGKISDYVFEVTPYQETVEQNGMKFKVDKTHDMDDKFIARLEEEAHDLGDMYYMPTPEETERIVNGTPQDVDAILGNKNRISGTENSRATATQQKLTKDSIEDVIQKEERDAAEALNSSTPEPQAAQTQEIVEEKIEMSDEDFLKQFGVN